MEEIAYDVIEKFPLPAKNKLWGEVSSYCFFILKLIYKNSII